MAGLNCGLKECEAMYTRRLLHREKKRLKKKKELLLVSLELRETISKNGLGFPGGAVVENLPANAGDTGLSPGLGGSHMPRSN